MIILAPSRRPRRGGEWNPGRAVTFIVTLAARRSVTLAARAAGMSRKSAYALKARDRAFATAWTAALEAHKVEEVEQPPVSPSHGNTSPSRMARERAFARRLAALREPATLAARRPPQ